MYCVAVPVVTSVSVPYTVFSALNIINFIYTHTHIGFHCYDAASFCPNFFRVSGNSENFGNEKPVFSANGDGMDLLVRETGMPPVTLEIQNKEALNRRGQSGSLKMREMKKKIE